MKKMIGVLMKFVPIFFFFASANIGNGKSTASIPQTIYMLIIFLMFWGIINMVTDKDKIPKMKNWTRVADVILFALFVVTATRDFLHRHDANVTVVNSSLMLFCCMTLYLHEKIRDQRVAKLLASTSQAKPETKRGLGEDPVT